MNEKTRKKGTPNDHRSPDSVLRKIPLINDLHLKAVKNLLPTTSEGNGDNNNENNSGASSIDKPNDHNDEISHIVICEPELLEQSINDKKIDVNKNLDRKGTTYLHVATCLFSIQCVKVLLENGAVVNSSLNTGETSLFYAIIGRNIELVKLLLNHYKIQKQHLSDYESLILTNYVQSVNSTFSNA